MVKRFPTIPSHAEVKCLFYDEHSSRQDGGSKCCRWRCGERSSSTRFMSCLRHLRLVQVTTFLIRICQAKQGLF